MLSVTIVMLFVLCVFAPLRLRLVSEIDFDRLSAKIVVMLWGVRFFYEDVRLTPKAILCSGSINSQLDYSALDFSGGVGLAKCVTVDGVCCYLSMNASSCSPFLLQAGDACCFVTAFLGVMLTHAKIHTRFSVNFSNNNLLCSMCVSLNIFEVLCFTTHRLIFGGNNGRVANK